MMSGMSGGSMLRTRRKDANVKPNRRLDRKSSRGMLYENEELRLRTININAEVERGQSDIKKLKRENEQLRREVGALRGEYDRLERLLKARHQQDNSDAEGSGSCCSDCESECCNVQNNVNAASDGKKRSGTPSRETKVVSIRENEGSCSMETCGLPTCGKLSAVPEESILRVPFTQNAPPCNCQCIKPENIGFVESVQPVQDYYTAVVTVPMASHLPDPQNIQLGPSIYPKAGLDILINNNNAFEKFEEFTMSPPIGFIIPSTSNCESYDKDSYQIVPNIDLSNENLIKTNQTSAQENQNINLNTGESGSDVNNLFNCLGNVVDKNCEDSYFVCNTKKIIQQMTVQNTNIVSTTNLTNCNCNTDNTNNNPDIIIVSSNSEVSEKPSFITEKNIELNYDYPKSIDFDEKAEKPVLKPIKIEEVKSQDIMQTTHTTTEVNSTVIFGRKNFVSRDRCKPNMFARSYSAPVEPYDREPIYATVQKLPKKLTRLNIKKLENEIKYIPPENKDDEDIPKPSNSTVNTQSILKSSDPESPDCTLKSNGTLPKLKVKLDSFSESSDKNDNNKISIPTKSPVVRKKKRFSIHFKRKNNKKPVEKKSSDASEVIDAVISDESKNGANYKGDSDRLLEQSSSVESPDTNKFKDSSPTFVCKKHKKQRHISRQESFKHKQCPSNYDHHHAHQCDKCSLHRKHHPGRRCEHVKNNCSPVRNYFKNDSYQEITTSHSERERTNSLSSSGHSGFSLATNKSRKMSTTHQDENIPWCGCWGNSCL